MLPCMTSALGLNLAPAMQEAIVATGIGVAGLVGAVLPDTK